MTVKKIFNISILLCFAMGLCSCTETSKNERDLKNEKIATEAAGNRLAESPIPSTVPEVTPSVEEDGLNRYYKEFSSKYPERICNNLDHWRDEDGTYHYPDHLLKERLDEAGNKVYPGTTLENKAPYYIPETVLENISTENLYQLLKEDKDILAAYTTGYDSVKMTYARVREGYNGVDELIQRPDCLSVVKPHYKKYSKKERKMYAFLSFPEEWGVSENECTEFFYKKGEFLFDQWIVKYLEKWQYDDDPFIDQKFYEYMKED